MEKYTLITGATGGLGKAFAVECAGRGQNLILTDISEDKLKVLAENLKKRFKRNILWMDCDLMDQQAREAMFGRLDRMGIEIDYTINVAGLDYEGGIQTLNSKKITRVLRVNTEATLDITRYIASAQHKDAFYIINVASMAGFYPMPLKALYSASKRAIIQFSLAVREEIRARGGHITVLCPAGLKTNPKVIDKIDAQGIMGRLTTVDVGRVVHRTLNRAKRNAPKYVPGVLNQLIVGFSSLIPDIPKAKYVFKRWSDAQNKQEQIRVPKGSKVLYD